MMMDYICTASIKSLTSPWGYKIFRVVFITFHIETWCRSHYRSASDSFSQFIPWWIVPKADGLAGGLCGEHSGGKLCVPPTVIHGLPGHFHSEGFALFNILESLPSIRRLLTAILQPGFRRPCYASAHNIWVLGTPSTPLPTGCSLAPDFLPHCGRACSIDAAHLEWEQGVLSLGEHKHDCARPDHSKRS